MKRKIELYGRLRDAGLGSMLVVDMPAKTSAREALNYLKPSFGPLLTGCVLASGDSVLSPSDTVPSSGRLALLPPVCGG